MTLAGVEPPLSIETRSLLFSIAHNALTNAYRHAEASRVSVHLEFGEVDMSLQVSDDGTGLPDDYSERGSGFANMTSAAERLDGRLHGIGSRLGYCPGCSRHDREVSMNPWQLIGRAQTPGGGAELVLYQRDSEFSLKADNLELMNSRVYGSEEAMARLGCQNLAKQPRARVLIGGLGMGYSVRTALDILGEDARVVVAELVPAVVEWNRGVLADLAGRPLDDRRTELHEADVIQLITAARGDYDAIMLDVDNGAEAIVRKGNNWLYSLPGLTATYAALRRGGVLAIWSAGSQPPFVRRLRRAGFEVDEVKVRARGGSSRKGGAHHVVWIATRG